VNEREVEVQNSLILGRVVRKRTMPEIFIPAKKSKSSTGIIKTTHASNMRRNSSSGHVCEVDAVIPSIPGPSHEQFGNNKDKTLKHIAVQTEPTQ
jgi:hypothetical protein